MEQTFFWDETPPQPYPNDIQETLREEVERLPKCSCSEAPESGCIC